MALRKINEFVNGLTGSRSRSAKVYRDAANDEYVVKFYSGGEYDNNADYFTSDKDDALDTGSLWVSGQDKAASGEDVDVSDDTVVDPVRSRRKREGKYLGKHCGKHLRGGKFDTVAY